MKQTCYLSLFLLFLHTSCTEQALLSGKLELPPDNSWASAVYLIQPRSLDEVAAGYAGQVIDSAAVQADGSFAFENLPDSPQPILLELAVQQKGERFANRLDNENPETDNYFPVIWKNGEQLEVAASAKNFQSSFSIRNPSPENAALLQLRDIRLEAYQQFLRGRDEEGHDAEQLLGEEKALLNYQQALMDFAENTDHLLPALTAIRWVSPEGDYERVPEFLVAQCGKWKGEYPGHPWVAQLCEKSSREQLPVLKGDQIPDFPLPMLSGDTVSLYQLLGERLTLLDLWASWCAPCRRENRDVLLPLWERHHDKGFQVIGYALDSSEKAWKGAIEKDGAGRWLHASHLQGDDAPLMEALRLQTIPANFLLDKEGRVVAKNLHGTELAKFVEEYLEEGLYIGK
ncbi:MAG: TlpA family protein disulfide reductase [Lewinellaceae bacterium]|nr:TlpA family protein disulfide reductase [Lewinellaceae bacterium]